VRSATVKRENKMDLKRFWQCQR